jgi:NAD(P)-dependent dehydrogenase (short-subunit alcohol dehydrogenase family)
MTTRRFQDRVLWVTGGGAGIGRAVALRFAEEGAAVGVATLDPDEAASVAEACRERGAQVCSVAADLADPDQVTAAHARIVAELGPVDVMVNNVGIGPPARFLDADDALFERVWTVNFMTAVRCTRLTLPAMLERGSGAIVNLGSAQALVGWKGHGAYAASKGAVMAWTRQLASELGGSGVRVNSIVPGATDTPMQGVHTPAERTALEATAALLHIIPRLGTAEEVAAAVAFAASDDASFMMGAQLVVDGGSGAKGASID